MFIDIVAVIIIAYAIFKGISNGFIVAIFSFFAFFIGLAAALKLSALVAEKLHEKWDIGGYWLPVLSFSIVFIGVVFLIKFTATIIKKAAGIVFMGWVDKLLGILLFAFIYLMVYSVILFYATKIYLISPEAQSASQTYSIIAPFGPNVISGLGKLIPFFSGMFSQLTAFFEGVSRKP